MIFLRILIVVLIMGLFLYVKLLPYQDKLNDKYKKIFDFFAGLFSPILNGLKKLFPPFQVGDNLGVDMSHIVFLAVLLLLLLLGR